MRLPVPSQCQHRIRPSPAKRRGMLASDEWGMLGQPGPFLESRAGFYPRSDLRDSIRYRCVLVRRKKAPPDTAGDAMKPASS